MHPQIRLITRADDAASAKSANRAIRQSFLEGVLRNTSVMAIGPALDDAVQTLGNLPGLCLGLHAALNCEWQFPKFGPLLPPAQVPSLLDDQGHLTAAPSVLAERNAPVEEMIAEIKAQLAKLRSLRLKIDYVDQHMGVGWVPGLNQAIADLCQTEGLIDSDAQFKRLPQVFPQPYPPALENLLGRLKAATPGTYIFITHPTFDDPEMQAYYRPGQPTGLDSAERDLDRQLFIAPQLRQFAAESHIEFVRFTDCV